MDTHLKGIGVENFRVFKDAQSFNFAPITILTGTNSSGKSSLINLLSLLKESFKNYNLNKKKIEDKDLFESFPGFSEDFIFETFGNFSNLTNHENDNKELAFTTQYGRLPGYEDSISLSVKYNYETGSTFGNLRSIEVFISSLEETDIVIFFRQFLRDYGLTEYNDLIDRRIMHVEVGEYDVNFNHYTSTTKCNYDILYALYISYRLYNSDIAQEINLLETALNKNDNAHIRKNIESILSKKNLIYSIRDIEDNSDMKLGISIYFPFEFRDFQNRPIDNYTDEHDVTYPGVFVQSKERGKYYIESKNELSFINAWCEDDKGIITAVNTLLKQYYKNDDEFTCHLRFHIDFLKYISSKMAFIQKFANYLPRIILEEYLKKKLPKNHTSDQLLENLIIPVITIILEGRQNSQVKNTDQALPTTLTTSIGENYFFDKMIEGTYAEIFNSLWKFKKVTLITNKRAFDERQYKIKNRNELYLLKQLNKQDGLNTIIKKYILDFDIAKDIKFEIDEELMMCKVLLQKNGKWVNVKDEGFGISKLIPLILSIKPEYDRLGSEANQEATYEPVIILIEEPESNLHPALQSKLADLFVDLSKRFNIQFIIETHSEYLIRKLQYLTAKNEINPSDTQIYYFHHPDRIPEGEKQIYPINIREDGSLTKNFGTGFFDEAGSQELQLYKIIQKHLANGSSLN